MPLFLDSEEGSRGGEAGGFGGVAGDHSGANADKLTGVVTDELVSLLRRVLYDENIAPTNPRRGCG